jgi:chemotaxis protein CheD
VKISHNTGRLSDGIVCQQVSAGNEDEAPRVYLHPGQIAASADPCTITTILGSCVAVCLWDPQLKAGGINHYLLPYRTSVAASPLRFGDSATRQLIAKMTALGCTKKNLRAKVFGGACVLEAFQSRTDDLGTRNVEIALKVLAEEQIPVIAEDLGGSQGRKLIFHTHDGNAWVRKI